MLHIWYICTKFGTYVFGTCTFFDMITHFASLQSSSSGNQVVIKVYETALLKNNWRLSITKSSELSNLDTSLVFYVIASLSLLTVLWFWEIISPCILPTSWSTGPLLVLGSLSQPLTWECHSRTCFVAFLGKLFQIQSFHF